MKMNWEKFKTLVHYVCDKADDPSCLGAVKLNKVLWYSESVHYMVHGAPITGETYVKRQLGPVPKHVVVALNELVAERKVARGKVDYFGFMKNEYIAIERPKLDTFNANEISIIDSAFEHVCIHNTARSISEETHGLIWEIAQMGEEMPLATVFAASVGEIDEEDVKWAQAHPVVARYANTKDNNRIGSGV